MHMRDSDDVNWMKMENVYIWLFKWSEMVFSKWNKLHHRKKKLGVLLIEHEQICISLYHWAIDNSLPVTPFN